MLAERRKASRLEKQLQRKLEQVENIEEAARLKADLHIAEVDRLYTLYFPYMERYVSLYPASAEPKTEDEKASSAALALRSKRPKMWCTVEAAAEEGQEALERLRDRRPAKDSQSKPRPKAPSARSSASKAGPQQQRQADAALGSVPPKAEKTARRSGDKHARNGTSQAADAEDSGSDLFEEG